MNFSQEKQSQTSDDIKIQLNSLNSHYEKLKKKIEIIKNLFHQAQTNNIQSTNNQDEINQTDQFKKEKKKNLNQMMKKKTIVDIKKIQSEKKPIEIQLKKKIKYELLSDEEQKNQRQFQIHDNCRLKEFDNLFQFYDQQNNYQHQIQQQQQQQQQQQLEEQFIQIKFQKTKQTSEENLECSICYQEYNEGDTLALLNCIHRFHLNCFQQWKQKSNSCPFCKNID